MVKIKSRWVEPSKFPVKQVLATIGLAVLISFIALSAGAFHAAPSAKSPDLLENITHSGSFTGADVIYLQNALRWLRDYMPEWYTYVTDAKPLRFSIETRLHQQGILSNARCCSAEGEGTVTFGMHLGQWYLGDRERLPGLQPEQIQFLSVLVHEVTHLRDQRTGRVGPVTDADTCIASEASANAKELEFARALPAVLIAGDADTRARYRVLADRHLHVTEDNANGVSWKLACLFAFTDGE